MQEVEYYVHRKSIAAFSVGRFEFRSGCYDSEENGSWRPHVALSFDGRETGRFYSLAYSL